MRQIIRFLCVWLGFSSGREGLASWDVQVRAFHREARLQHDGGSSQTLWTRTYLKGREQSVSEQESAESSAFSSFGQELSVADHIWYPHLYLSGGVSQSGYHVRPNEKIEDLTPQLAFAWVTNVQGRWMPFARLGLAQHRLKLLSQRVEARPLPTTLGLAATQDTFGVSRRWERAELWNGQAGLGCKFYTFPSTAIVVEYRYTDTLRPVSIRQQKEGISSFREGAAFVQETELRELRLRTQEWSLALVADF